MSKVITRTVQAQLVNQAPAPLRPLAAALRYETADPLAVEFVFPPEVSLDGAEVTWAFSRELLTEGLRGSAGEGDIHVRPCGQQRTVIEFYAEGDVAVLEFRTAELALFLQYTYDMVPAGSEMALLDLEQGLTELLRSM